MVNQSKKTTGEPPLIPARPHRVYLAHNACLNAAYDFNLVKEGLRLSGFEIVARPEEADEVIYSVCAVRDIWVEDAGKQIDALHKANPRAKVTVTGCGASVAPQQLRDAISSSDVSTASHDEVLKDYSGLTLEVVDKSLSQNTTTNFEGPDEEGLAVLRRRVGPQKTQVIDLLRDVDSEHGTSLEKLYRSTTKGFVFYHEHEPVEFLTVTRSCPYRCSFCAIPRGRGAFVSVGLNDILDKAQAALSRGVSRFTLVGDEVGNYGVGASGPKFQDLVTSLVNLDPEIRLSIRYLEPKPFIRNYAFLKRLCVEERIELLYLSLQSGSQRVLDRMNRNYKISEATELCRELKDCSPTIFYSNWMVGFPGESREDYEATKSLVERLNFQINVAVPFSARPDTPAETMAEQISETDKYDRRDDLVDLIAALKSSEFASRIDFLDPSRREEIVRAIQVAERFEYGTDSEEE